MTPFIDILIQHYSAAGVALSATLVVLVAIQIMHYTRHFSRVKKYLNNKCRQKIHPTPPTISVVVPMFSEDYDYIENTLPLIMGQEGVQFEVVIVYVGNDKDFYDDILRLKQVLGNIKLTKIEQNERFPISVKTTLNVGIKAARHDHIVFTTTDVRPTSERWLLLMAKGFQRGDIVIGYCGIESDDNLSTRLIRTSRMVQSVNWLSSAAHGKPYRAIRTNMGFTKTLYNKAKGFNHLNMNIGEDDLFMQKIMTKLNTSIILNPQATVVEKCWGGGAWWLDNQRFFRSAEALYPTFAKEPRAWEMTSRVLMAAVYLVILVMMPLEIKAIATLLILLRLLVVLLSVKKVARRLGEKGIVGTYILYDLLSPLFELWLKIKMLKRDERVWK